MDIRLQPQEQALHGAIAEHDDIVDEAESVDQLRAVRGGQDRPPLPLQRAHRLVVVDRDDQSIRFGRAAAQIANVPDVQQVEATVGERNRAAGRAIARNRNGKLPFEQDHARRPSSDPSCNQLSVVVVIGGHRVSQPARVTVAVLAS
jgi:hypothetical protein